MLAGIGMGLFFAPVANVVLSAVRPEEEGQASGANNALRETGGVFGVAVLAAIFAQYGHYPPPEQATSTASCRLSGSAPSVVGLGALIALLIPKADRVREDEGVPSFAGMGSCVPLEVQHIGLPETVAVAADA